jgi:hypothetical protein
LARPTKKRRG